MKGITHIATVEDWSRVRGHLVTYLCGKEDETSPFYFPTELYESVGNKYIVRCKDCFNHPTVPLLILAGAI